MLNIILFALFVSLFGTYNGRQLIITGARQIAGVLPYSLRRLAVGHAHLLPLFISRRLLFFITQPTASERRWVHKIIRDWKGVWITPHAKNSNEAETQAPDLDRVILYIHGGGFSMGYSTMYMPFFQQMIQSLHSQSRLTTAILSIEYSLSPESKWPVASEECLGAYRYLVHEIGVSPSKIVLMGDSAGGNLALTTLLMMRNLKLQRQSKEEKSEPPLPLPFGIALISPCVDLTHQKYPKQPDTLTPALIEMYITNYVPQRSTRTDPLLSPIHASLDGLEHVAWFISYGQHEILGSSIKSFVDKVKTSGYDVTVAECRAEGHVSLVNSLMATSLAAYERDKQKLFEWIGQ